MSKTTVVLLHGWPGTCEDFYLVRDLLPKDIRVIAPDLTGFGKAFKGHLPIEEATAGAHADRLLEFINSQNITNPIIAGYDIGSRVAQTLALKAPDQIGGIVITPAYAGIGNRSSASELQPIFWYQHFHRLEVSGDILDGNRSAITAYIEYIHTNWSYKKDFLTRDHFRKLIDYYARPDAFRASIAWYSANQGYDGTDQITVPATMLWPEQDPLFPIEWSDRLSEFFTTAKLTTIPNCGHFVPLEAARIFADAIVTQIEEFLI